ncbi:radical SAM protein [Cystobacter fuscus]|uniref:Radical SAM protein n=1 Tax=Cystobacter fuscus TaxID=43 RepID=A0A250IX68_9BACT|nr:B12-binding domain-containing radical SAM protein [Cystobacter fuscus]ATB35878.1 radical SAM protein [Cystobacter fuscus]
MSQTSRSCVHIVQLPFPSLGEPHEAVRDYYRDYSARFASELAGYFIPEGSLWELPLWVAHIAGMLKEIGYEVNLVDMSKVPAEAEACARFLLEETRPGSVLMMSPLAQNFDLALSVSRTLKAEGRQTVLGGNMATLAGPEDASHVHRGQVSARVLAEILQKKLPGLTEVAGLKGGIGRLDSKPDYTLLTGYKGRVPLLRLNASHGCLYACSFCGDAWSRQLHVVDPAVLEHEVQQFERLFPEARLIYIGDKTFGQSHEAVKNLLAVFANRPHYKFIVQTHVLNVNETVIEAMRRLGVVVVEMGFETADSEVLKESSKPNLDVDIYARRIQALSAAGMKVVLNVLGGLPQERAASHELTMRFLQDSRNEAWLYNLYNFVPYPLTPLFPVLRERIHDWNFAHWREDGPPVFQPYHQTVEQSWNQFLEKVHVAHSLISRPSVSASMEAAS